MADKEQVLEVPFNDCTDCLHVNVCKFIKPMAKTIKDGLMPLDPEDISCVHYLGASAVLGLYDEEYEGEPDVNDGEPDPIYAKADEFYQKIRKAVVDLLSSDRRIRGITMNGYRYTLIGDHRASEVACKNARWVLGVAYPVTLDGDIPDWKFDIEVER